MKKILQLLSIGLILIPLFSTCSIEKRRYVTGYNIQWNNSTPDTKRNEFVQNHKLDKFDKIITTEPVNTGTKIVDETATASANNSTIRSKHILKKSNHHTLALPDECDVIILKNGDEIKVKAYENSPKKIKYKKCEEISGPTYEIKKSEVLMIKNSDGSKDNIFPDSSAETHNKPIEPIENDRSGVFGILSIGSIISGAFITIFAGGIALLFLIPLAIIFGAIGCGRGRKNKGLAIFGLILGTAATIFILIAIAIFSSQSGAIGHCFIAGTKILMGDETEINIQSIKKGDSVLIYDFKNSRPVKTEVERLVAARHADLFKLTFYEGEITVTDDHPFWVAGKGWTSLNPKKSNNNYRQEDIINQLTVGDSLFIPAANKFTTLLNIQHLNKEQLTYTIELKQGNNFIANGLLVKTEQSIETQKKRMLTLY